MLSTPAVRPIQLYSWVCRLNAYMLVVDPKGMQHVTSYVRGVTTYSTALTALSTKQ